MCLAENVLAGFVVVPRNAAIATPAPRPASASVPRTTPSLEWRRTGLLHRRWGFLPGGPARPPHTSQLGEREQQRRDDHQEQPAERLPRPPDPVAEERDPEADEPDRAVAGDRPALDGIRVVALRDEGDAPVARDPQAVHAVRDQPVRAL